MISNGATVREVTLILKDVVGEENWHCVRSKAHTQSKFVDNRRKKGSVDNANRRSSNCQHGKPAISGYVNGLDGQHRRNIQEYVVVRVRAANSPELGTLDCIPYCVSPISVSPLLNFAF